MIRHLSHAFAVILLFAASNLCAQTFSHVDDDQSNISQSTFTFTPVDFGAADADRDLIIAVGAKGSSPRSVVSVTVGGVSATIVASQEGPTTSTGIAIAAVPAGTSGTVVVQLSGGAGQCGISVYRATGLASSTPTDTDNNTSDDPTLTLTKADGITVASAVTYNSTTATWTNLTENRDANVGIMTITAASEESSAGDSTITCDFASITNSDSCMSVATWAYGASGPNVRAVHFYRQQMSR